MADLIRGKVARVLNSREVVLNVGAENGVVSGMLFKIFDPGDDDGRYIIRDPDDTTNVIGSIGSAPKITVSVSKVQDKLCVASTLERDPSLHYSSLYWTLMPWQWISRYETLRQNDSAVPAPIDKSESFVKIGDIVVQVSEQRPN